MAIDLGGVTVQAVKLALDVATLRHNTIANNIANAKTPGYQPLRVSFEDQLRLAGSSVNGAAGDDALRTGLERLTQAVADGRVIKSDNHGSVQLDSEMVRLADNTLRYRALLQGLAKRTAVINMAIDSTRG